VCYAWHPTQWDGSKGHWADVAARCELKDKFTTAGESCENGALIRPRASVPASAPVHVVPQKQVLTGELYAHQKEAFDQFKDATEMGVFAEMGCGKSAVVLRIASYKFKKGEIDQLLIVAPNAVHVQWAHEQVPLWLDCPYNIQCLFGRGGAKVAYPFDDDPEFLDVVCINIDTFSTPTKWKDIADWSNGGKTFIVLDEATAIKSVSSQRTQRMLYAFNTVKYKPKTKTIMSSVPNSVARAVLTGTPVTNGPIDLWAIGEFLRPMYFGRNYYAFKARYGMFTSLVVNDRVIQVPLSEECWHGIKAVNTFHEANEIFGCSPDTFDTVHSQDHYQGPYKHADELKELLKPIAWFKDIKDCVDMPSQNYITRECAMTSEIEQCYEDMVNELIAQYEDHTMVAKSKLTALIRLQQISSGFICDKTYGQETTEDAWTEAVKAFTEGREITQTVEEDKLSLLYGLTEEEDILPAQIKWIGKSNGKLDALYRDVDECAKPVIIATRFTAEADRIFNDLSGKYDCCLMTGWKRVGTLEEFKEGKYQVMVANTAVINRGFNLQNSHVILRYSNTFSLENALQLEGRIFRLGQTSPCEYVDYIYPGTIDDKITSCLRMKRNLLDYIRDVNNIKELIS
jgi:SNF2 family DNA or RNA helicase